MDKGPLFYAKILLFGEYGIIQDAMGLTIPYPNFQGALEVSPAETEEQKASNTSLWKFFQHLASLDQGGELKASLDLERFRRDLETGMHFDSSIPQGFGVGSSGALVAALYDRYAQDKIEPNEADFDRDKLVELKQSLGQMESYFHGRSSGIDPLICYMRIPLLIKGQGDLGTVGMPPETQESKSAVFLLNSGAPGETQPMVHLFMEKMKQEGFRNMLKEQFTKYNDACIQDFLAGNTKPLFQNIKHLSKLLLDYFNPMIPSVFRKLWKQGIDTNAYYLKLCGSGGGGFVLGFTQDVERAQELLKDYEMEIIYRF